MINDGQYLLVIGGGGDYKGTPVMTEKCSINETTVDCVSQEPKLRDYWYYPELVIVPKEFCWFYFTAILNLYSLFFELFIITYYRAG